MLSTKPSDFFLGTVEFFAILLPGAAFVYIIYPSVSKALPQDFMRGSSAMHWAAFLVASYIFGHLLHAVGGKLDFLYGEIYLAILEQEHHGAVQLIKRARPGPISGQGKLASTLVARAYSAAPNADAGTSLYDWCLSFTRLKNPVAAAEIDRLQADSKFFRSLMLVLVALMVVAAAEGASITPLVAFLLLLFSGWRFCELRWNATKRVHEYYLLLHSYIRSSPSITKTLDVEALNGLRPGEHRDRAVSNQSSE